MSTGKEIIEHLEARVNELLEANTREVLRRRALDWSTRVASWLRRAGVRLPTIPRSFTISEGWGHVAEEFQELVEAETPEEIAKEGADVIFTVLQFMLRHGVDPAVAMDLVCAANDTKFDPVTGEPTRDPETGKILKGPHYQTPDMSRAFGVEKYT